MTGSAERRRAATSVWGAALLTALALAGIQGILLIAAYVQMIDREIPFGYGMQAAAHDPLNMALAQAFGIGIALMLGLRHYHRQTPTREALGIRPVRTLYVLLALVAGAALQFPLTELSNLLREVWPMSIEDQLEMRRLIDPGNPGASIAVVIAAVAVAPVAEEAFYRGLLLPGLSRRYGELTAIVFSAVLFGVSHVDPVAIAYATVAGLVLGTVAVRTRSIVPCIALHAAVNAVPVLLPERVYRIPGFNTVSERVYHLPPTLLVASGVVAAAAVLAIVRLTDAERS